MGCCMSSETVLATQTIQGPADAVLQWLLPLRLVRVRPFKYTLFDPWLVAGSPFVTTNNIMEFLNRQQDFFLKNITFGEAAQQHLCLFDFGIPSQSFHVKRLSKAHVGNLLLVARSRLVQGGHITVDGDFQGPWIAGVGLRHTVFVIFAPTGCRYAVKRVEYGDPELRVAVASAPVFANEIA